MFSVLLDDLDCVCLSVWLSDLWILLWDFAVKFAVKVTSWRHYKVHRLAGSRLTEPSDKLSCSSLSYSDDSWPQDVCVRWMTSERQIRQFTCPPVGLINLNLLVQFFDGQPVHVSAILFWSPDSLFKAESRIWWMFELVLRAAIIPTLQYLALSGTMRFSDLLITFHQFGLF